MTDRAEERVDRRSELVRTAYREMARDGVHRVPLQQIAQAAGVSKGLLLYHFATKDAMVLEAMEWVLEATAARIRSRIAAADGAEGQLGAVLDAIWIDPDANRDFFRFYLDGVEHQARAPEFEGLGERGRRIINGLYLDVITRGMEAGVFSTEDPTEAAIHMRAVIEGSFLQWLQTSDWRHTHAEYKQLCLQAVARVLGTGQLS